MRFLDPAFAWRLEPGALEPRGFTIIRGASAVSYFTPWGDRQSDKGTFACAVETLPADVTITFLVQKKFRNETDDEAKDGNSVSFTAVGVKTVRQTTLDDLYRYKITIGGSASIGHADLWFPAPSWEVH